MSVWQVDEIRFTLIPIFKPSVQSRRPKNLKKFLWHFFFPNSSYCYPLSAKNNLFLTHPTVQNLISSHPNLVLMFLHSSLFLTLQLQSFLFWLTIFPNYCWQPAWWCIHQWKNFIYDPEMIVNWKQRADSAVPWVDLPLRVVGFGCKGGRI